jgi:hypothetical protein
MHQAVKPQENHEKIEKFICTVLPFFIQLFYRKTGGSKA